MSAIVSALARGCRDANTRWPRNAASAAVAPATFGRSSSRPTSASSARRRSARSGSSGSTSGSVVAASSMTTFWLAPVAQRGAQQRDRHAAGDRVRRGPVRLEEVHLGFGDRPHLELGAAEVEQQLAAQVFGGGSSSARPSSATAVAGAPRLARERPPRAARKRPGRRRSARACSSCSAMRSGPAPRARSRSAAAAWTTASSGAESVARAAPQRMGWRKRSSLASASTPVRTSSPAAGAAARSSARRAARRGRARSRRRGRRPRGRARPVRAEPRQGHRQRVGDGGRGHALDALGGRRGERHAVGEQRVRQLLDEERVAARRGMARAREVLLDGPPAIVSSTPRHGVDAERLHLEPAAADVRADLLQRRSVAAAARVVRAPRADHDRDAQRVDAAGEVARGSAATARRPSARRRRRSRPATRPPGSPRASTARAAVRAGLRRWRRARRGVPARRVGPRRAAAARDRRLGARRAPGTGGRPRTDTRARTPSRARAAPATLLGRCARAASASAVLPIPAGPSISNTDPPPAVAASSVSTIAASSASRPTSRPG